LWGNVYVDFIDGNFYEKNLGVIIDGTTVKENLSVIIDGTIVREMIKCYERDKCRKANFKVYTRVYYC
jgi:hypothetical protein